jgi:phosphoglycolate phosphatase
MIQPKELFMYQYLLFDLDGTLTNPKEGITRSVQHALRHFGIEVADPDTLTPYIGPPLIPSFMEFHGLTQEQALEALQVYRQRFSTVGLFENEVLDGVPEMLRALKQNGRFVAVASSKPEPYVIRILEHFDLLQYFDEVVGASMDEKRSAKKDIIEEALRRMGKAPGDRDILMIGDRMHDVEGAQLCGLDSLGIYTGFAPEGELENAGATYVFHTIRDMADFLLRD